MRVLHHNTLTPKPEARLPERLCPAAAWNVERATRLHRHFLTVEKRLADGLSFKKANGNFFWRMRRSLWRSNGRKVRLAKSTIYNLFKKWRDEGRTPECLLLRFRPGYPKCPLNFLLTFLEFCAAPMPSLSLLQAWNKFNRRRRSAPSLGYSGMLRYLNSPRFRAIQRAHRKNDPAAAARSRAEAEAFVRSRYAPKGGRS